MTAIAETRPASSIADPPHAHTRSCYWDCREARWQCGGPAATTAAPTGSRRS